MKVGVKVILAILFVSLFLSVGYIIYSEILDEKQEPEVITNDIEGKLNDIGELATAEYGYIISQTAEKPSKEVIGFKIPFTSSKVIYSYEGLIKAGIDFQAIKITVSETKKEIIIELPEVEILSKEVFFESLIVYDEKHSPFNKFTFKDMNLSLVDLQTTATEAAIENGILERAKENAKKIMEITIGYMYDLNEYSVEYY
jgi:hypothetical protein